MSALTPIGTPRRARGFVYPAAIDNSIWLDGAADYLTYTPTALDSRKQFTVSLWVRRLRLGVAQSIFGRASGAAFAGFTSSDTIQVFHDPSGGAHRVTNAVFRDIGAWYHIVIVTDTPNADADSRLQIWVNGVLQSYSSTRTITQNDDSDLFTNSVATEIGRYGSGYNQAIYADIYFVDGLALTPDNFAEEVNGVWVPSEYPGGFGTEGSHLDFETSGNLGDDVSGNGNDWTGVSVGAGNQSPDTPTVNMQIVNDLLPISITTLLDDGRRIAHSSGTRVNPGTRISKSGKWYAEIFITKTGSWFGYNGVSPADDASSPDWNIGVQEDGYYWVSNGTLYHNTGTTSVTPTYTNNDVLMIGLDLDNGWLFFGKNGTWLKTDGTSHSDLTNSANAWATDLLTISTAGWLFSPGASHTSGVTTETLRCSAADMSYSAPSDFMLADDNYPEPDVLNSLDGFVVVTDSEANIETTLAAARAGWSVYVDILKNRDAAQEWEVIFSDDSGYFLPLATAAGKAAVTTKGGADKWLGISLRVGDKYGTATGTTTHTTGAATNIDTGIDFDMAWLWRADAAGTDIWCFHRNLTSGKLIYLDKTNAETTDSAITKSGTTLTIASAEASGTYRWLAFKAVPQFSAMGAYTGNGAADGSFAMMDFRPAWFGVKNISTAIRWATLDAARETYNKMSSELSFDDNGAEAGGGMEADFCSCGVKQRVNNTPGNGSGNRMIFFAFAEQPGKYANAR